MPDRLRLRLVGGPVVVGWIPTTTSSNHNRSPFHVCCVSGCLHRSDCRTKQPQFLFHIHRAHLNQPTNQPTDRPTNRPTDRPTDRPTNQTRVSESKRCRSLPLVVSPPPTTTTTTTTTTTPQNNNNYDNHNMNHSRSRSRSRSHSSSNATAAERPHGPPPPPRRRSARVFRRTCSNSLWSSCVTCPATWRGCR